MSGNRFSDCRTVDQVIRQAVGAGSRCWVTRQVDGDDDESVFDSDEAVKIADEAFERVVDLIDQQRPLA